ncbi:MAG: M23 family metallopeptidase [Lachnospiraceae bacterium]|nr:M23 family metallopeptidase [Lachnospiraceae bacterium]
MRRSRRDYRRDWRENNRRERMVLIASSAFVLAALTMSGLYLRNQNAKVQNDGYTIDFTALENSAGNKYDEIAEANTRSKDAMEYKGTVHWSTTDGQKTSTGATANKEQTAKLEEEPLSASSAVVENTFANEVEDELDYMPLEVDSHTVEIAEPADELIEPEEVVWESSVETSGLTRPVNGEVLLPYSMDSSIYFKTLDQYKYNPAVIYQAAEDTPVLACAEGRVADIYEDAEIGRAVKLDLGNGYEAVYGQLKEIYVVEDAHVSAGEVLGTVALPTKYYSVEGGNLYFCVKKDGVTVNPEELYR